MGLKEHAEYELKRAGFDKPDSDYGGMLYDSTMKLINVFADEGHSGFSAQLQIELFRRLASFKTLSPLTNSPDEWTNVSELGGPDGKQVWQNKRDSSYFSNDGGKTGYSVDDKDRKVVTFDEV